jgi:predicted HNH restriction endonuclease
MDGRRNLLTTRRTEASHSDIRMGKRLPYTPNGKIRQALRLLWLRSRERSQALKNSGYRCVYCGVKQSTAKGREVRLDVHHKRGIKWDDICAMVRERLLQTPDDLAPCCEKCHAELTAKQADERTNK